MYKSIKTAWLIIYMFEHTYISNLALNWAKIHRVLFALLKIYNKNLFMTMNNLLKFIEPHLKKLFWYHKYKFQIN